MLRPGARRSAAPPAEPVELASERHRADYPVAALPGSGRGGNFRPSPGRDRPSRAAPAVRAAALPRSVGEARAVAGGGERGGSDSAAGVLGRRAEWWRASCRCVAPQARSHPLRSRQQVPAVASRLYRELRRSGTRPAGAVAPLWRGASSESLQRARHAPGVFASVSSITRTVRAKSALPKSFSRDPIACVTAGSLRCAARAAALSADQPGDRAEDGQMAQLGMRGHLVCNFPIPRSQLQLAALATAADNCQRREHRTHQHAKSGCR